MSYRVSLVKPLNNRLISCLEYAKESPFARHCKLTPFISSEVNAFSWNLYLALLFLCNRRCGFRTDVLNGARRRKPLATSHPLSEQITCWNVCQTLVRLKFNKTDAVLRIFGPLASSRRTRPINSLPCVCPDFLGTEHPHHMPLIPLPWPLITQPLLPPGTILN